MFLSAGVPVYFLTSFQTLEIPSHRILLLANPFLIQMIVVSYCCVRLSIASSEQYEPRRSVPRWSKSHHSSLLLNLQDFNCSRNQEYLRYIIKKT